MEKWCQLERYVKGTMNCQEAEIGISASLHWLLCKQETSAVSTQKKFSPVLGDCTILREYLHSEWFFQITFYHMYHMWKCMIGKKRKIEGMSHFWCFAILIRYISTAKKCQGENPGTTAWMVLNSFTHLYCLKSSINFELKTIKNAMLVNSWQLM